MLHQGLCGVPVRCNGLFDSLTTSWLSPDSRSPEGSLLLEDESTTSTSLPTTTSAMLAAIAPSRWCEFRPEERNTDICESRPCPVADLPITNNIFRTCDGLSNALPFSGEPAARAVR